MCRLLYFCTNSCIPIRNEYSLRQNCGRREEARDDAETGTVQAYSTNTGEIQLVIYTERRKPESPLPSG